MIRKILVVTVLLWCAPLFAETIVDGDGIEREIGLGLNIEAIEQSMANKADVLMDEELPTDIPSVYMPSKYYDATKLTNLNQGNLGSCYSFGHFANLIFYSWLKNYSIANGLAAQVNQLLTSIETANRVSPMQAISYCTSYYNGGWGDEGLELAKKHGIIYLKDVPYKAARINPCPLTKADASEKIMEWGYVANGWIDVDQIKPYIMKYGAVAIAVNASYLTVTKANVKTGNQSLNHSVLAIGWDENNILDIVNSWHDGLWKPYYYKGKVYAASFVKVANFSEIIPEPTPTPIPVDMTLVWKILVGLLILGLGIGAGIYFGRKN